MTIKPFWTRPLLSCFLAGCMIAAAVVLTLSAPQAKHVLAADKPADATKTGWDQQAAARYLDGREIYWQGWDRAQKDHGTLCVSCHTQATYGLARPALRHELGEQGPSSPEQVMLASIQKRVRLWKEMDP